MPESYSGVFVDQLSLEEWDEEDITDQSDTNSDSEDDTDSRASSQSIKVRSRSLDCDEKCQYARRDAEIDWNQSHRPLKAVFALEYCVLDCRKHQSTKGTCDRWSNAPRCGDLTDGATGPFPFYGSLRCEPDTYSRADDGLNGQQWVL